MVGDALYIQQRYRRICKLLLISPSSSLVRMLTLPIVILAVFAKDANFHYS